MTPNTMLRVTVRTSADSDGLCCWPRSGDQVRWLCLLRVPRCVLRVYKIPGLVAGDSWAGEDKGTGSNFLPDGRETPALRGLRVLGGREGKDRLTVS